MTDRVQWIEHQGQPILFSNCAGLQEDEYLQAMDETQRQITAQPAGSVVLTLIDVSHSPTSRTIIAKGHEMAAAIRERGVITVDAVVGIRRWQRPIAQAVRRDVHFADSIEAAKNWLVKQNRR